LPGPNMPTTMPNTRSTTRPAGHMRHRIGLVCLVVLTGLLMAAPPSEAATTITVPQHATLVIDGHGWGSGKGMSRYGAQGAALQGLSTKQILQFYYPHTEYGHLRNRSVTVLLDWDTDHNTTVVNMAGLQVHSFGSGITKTLPTTGEAGEASQWRLAPARGGRTKVSYSHPYFHIGWHVWKVLPGDAEFRAPGPITLINRGVGDERTFRGSLQLRTRAGAPSWNRVTVNKVSLEQYVQGTVHLPYRFDRAAQRALAIATRTFAAVALASPSKQPWRLVPTLRENYTGVDGETGVTDAVVAETTGRVLMYHGAPASTPVTPSSGGWTVSGGKPYLPAQKDPYDATEDNTSFHSWSVQIEDLRIEQEWPALGNLTSISIDRRDGHGEWNGRVLSMSLHGTKGDVNHISGNAFRAKLGLYSTWVTISVQPPSGG
jgi:stage II sporulation protein D